MRVFRRRNVLGYAALLALAMQGMLAFAHTHTHAYGFAGATGLMARAVTSGMCRAGVERPCPPQAPHNDNSSCPICWSVSLASAVVLQPPPIVPLPRPLTEAPAPVRFVAFSCPGATVHFQARGPPLRASA